MKKKTLLDRLVSYEEVIELCCSEGARLCLGSLLGRGYIERNMPIWKWLELDSFDDDDKIITLYRYFYCDKDVVMINSYYEHLHCYSEEECLLAMMFYLESEVDHG